MKEIDSQRLEGGGGGGGVNGTDRDNQIRVTSKSVSELKKKAAHINVYIFKLLKNWIE